MMAQSTFTSSNNGNSNNNGIFSPSLDEFDKDDRRGCCGKLRAYCHSRKAQYQERLNDDRYYEDTYNPFPWSCSFGTREDDGIWLNRSDQGGILMAVTVWLLIGAFLRDCFVLSIVQVHLSNTHLFIVRL